MYYDNLNEKLENLEREDNKKANAMQSICQVTKSIIEFGEKYNWKTSHGTEAGINSFKKVLDSLGDSRKGSVKILSHNLDYGLFSKYRIINLIKAYAKKGVIFEVLTNDTKVNCAEIYSELGSENIKIKRFCDISFLNNYTSLVAFLPELCIVNDKYIRLQYNNSFCRARYIDQENFENVKSSASGNHYRETVIECFNEILKK